MGQRSRDRSKAGVSKEQKKATGQNGMRELRQSEGEVRETGRAQMAEGAYGAL